MVSKLNIMQFQRVNLPLVAPVTSRLPSGTQHTALIGQRSYGRAVRKDKEGGGGWGGGWEGNDR